MSRIHRASRCYSGPQAMADDKLRSKMCELFYVHKLSKAALAERFRISHETIVRIIHADPRYQPRPNPGKGYYAP